MSSIQKVIAYDNAIAVTVSDATDDPNGPFAGLLCLTSGTAKITLYGAGVNGTTFVTVPMTAGQYFQVTTRRVWSTGTTGTYLGLISPIVRQGT
jgi:hypothetical protein